GHATYESMVYVEGRCEVGLPVYVNVSGLYSQSDCLEDGTFNIKASLPLSEGVWPMVTHQIDLAGNRMVDARLVILDQTAPSANLVWNMTECERQPTAPAWGTPRPAECVVSVDLSILSDDVISWSIELSNSDVDAYTDSGEGSEFEGLQPQTFIAEGGVGTWTATVELTDAAGNRQRFVINTDLSAAEATIGEQLKTPGSLHNLSGIALIVILLSVLQSFRKRNQTQDDPWDDSNLEHLVRGDGLFDDDEVV
ncbi:MAG TPA: hypothetical protein HA309_04750, partial [Candidatus Thalassarchaeaceae archaeon]|nr:hypothetical protein [Candidatus Thalassarchaeaceae archaeon]